ncbi:MAG: DUF4325 domain-containing protein [Chlorobi bacterium]|nr:DUF4325 domain-containing protein [Chlorobiota bacterium]
MPNRPRSVNRIESRIVFSHKIDWAATIDFRKALYNAVSQRGYSELQLDFSDTEKAYPNGIVPIIAEVAAYRNLGVDFEIIPPRNSEVMSLFFSNSWLHYLNPNIYSIFDDSGSGTHLALHRFSDDNQLNNLVNKAVNICLQQLVFASGVPQAFEWAINELAGNILVHAGGAPGWIQVSTFREQHRLAMVICDRGVGIPKTISEKYNVRNDIESIELAIRKGVTSKPDFGQGNGLAGSIAIAQVSRGMFALTSGQGRVRVLNGKVEPQKNFPPVCGTIVELQFDTDREIDLPKALWGHKPIDIFETNFESDNSDESTFTLRDFASSFGNRITGERMRTLIMNLLKQTDGRPIRIDMSNVNVISSSFADELFGKLFIEFGPMDFGRIIKFHALNPTCKSIIDYAVSQRIAQAFSLNK